MTDRLKLSDPTGDAEVDKIAVAAEQEDRIQQLRKNIAALQSKLAKQNANAAPSPAPAANNKIGARKHGSFKAISTAPSINWTPHGPTMVPVPYPVVQDLSSSVNTARTVRFNGCPVYLLDASTQPKCTGDERGTGKGIKSGTVSGEVKPVQGSSTVRVEGKQVVREGDVCTMNGGNCPGIYVTTPSTSGAAPKEALATSNPSKHPGLQAAEARIKQWANEMQDHLRNVLKQPVEAGIGAAKSYANTLPETLDMLLKAGMEQHATEQENAALTSSVFGQTTAARVLMESAAAARQQGEEIDLPKFTMNNAGQKGGDAIATAVQLVAGLGGGIKGSGKIILKVGKAGSSGASTSRKIMPATSAAKPGATSGGGVRVIGAGSSAATIYPVHTAADEAFFWSGKTTGLGGDAVARQIAMEKGGTTLETLIDQRGIKMPAWDTTNPDVVKAWKTISAEYAAGASGTVRVVLGKDLRPGNVWETAELPALKSNPRVEKIIAIDPALRTETEIYARGKK